MPIPEPRPLLLEDLIDNAMRREVERDRELEPPRDYIGASMIGQKCDRAIWYDFRWANLPDFPPRIRRRFASGDSYETRVVERLARAGFWVSPYNPKARNAKRQWAGEYGPLGGLLRGHMDGFVWAPRELWARVLPEPDSAPGGAPGGALEREAMLDALDGAPVLLEVKLASSAKYTYAADDTEYLHPKRQRTKGRTEGRFFEMARKGVAKARPRHLAQMQAYMGFSRVGDRGGKVQWRKWKLGAPLSYALYVAVNGDTDQWYAELVPYEPRLFERVVAKASAVARADRPPARQWSNPQWGDCRFCDHRDTCHRGDAASNVSCRMCEHAELRIPGDRGFFGTTAQWFCTLHGRGIDRAATPCDRYLEISEHAPGEVGF